MLTLSAILTALVISIVTLVLATILIIWYAEPLERGLEAYFRFMEDIFGRDDE